MAQVTFDTAVGGDGSTVSDDASPTTGLANGGHRTRLVPAFSQIVAIAQWLLAFVNAKVSQITGYRDAAANSATAAAGSANAAAASASTALNAPGTAATSATVLTVGTGSKSLTVQSGKLFTGGVPVMIALATNPATVWMYGQVSSYDAGTGALIVSVTATLGSGSSGNWSVFLVGPQGIQGVQGPGSSGTGLQKGNGAGGFVSAVAGADYPTVVMAGRRNQVINGAFQINQRGYASGSATTAGQYTFDRWKVTGAGGVTYATANNKTTVTIPAGQTLQQVIEGVSLQSGSYVLSWEGTAQGRIAGGAYGASGAVTAVITGGANTTIEFSAGTVANVQFELGAVSSPFEVCPYQQQLAMCQRYYEVSIGAGKKFPATASGGHQCLAVVPVAGSASGNAGAPGKLPFCVQKRVTPTVRIADWFTTIGAVGINTGGSRSGASIAMLGSSGEYQLISFDSSSAQGIAATDVIYFQWEASAEL